MLPYQHTIVNDGTGGSLICLSFVTQAGPDVLASQFTEQDNLEPVHTITSYPLHDYAAPLQPAAERTGMTADEAVSTRLDLANARRQGWQLCCPHAFRGLKSNGTESYYKPSIMGNFNDF